ncbi:hypothetical protein EVAR_32039_1 [Eumeta japonica]|uniref:Uncharacterized protein n=1 Tax=Eumeta variegata TaxID=151549 RepID=A0A4C1WN87_EUMVA|nr:hypothetical protein EVAR_32039_1 [Eumeta japonica]
MLTKEVKHDEEIKRRAKAENNVNGAYLLYLTVKIHRINPSIMEFSFQLLGKVLTTSVLRHTLLHSVSNRWACVVSCPTSVQCGSGAAIVRRHKYDETVRAVINVLSEAQIFLKDKRACVPPKEGSPLPMDISNSSGVTSALTVSWMAPRSARGDIKAAGTRGCLQRITDTCIRTSDDVRAGLAEAGGWGGGGGIVRASLMDLSHVTAASMAPSFRVGVSGAGVTTQCGLLAHSHSTDSTLSCLLGSRRLLQLFDRQRHVHVARILKPYFTVAHRDQSSTIASGPMIVAIIVRSAIQSPMFSFRIAYMKDERRIVNSIPFYRRVICTAVNRALKFFGNRVDVLPQIRTIHFDVCSKTDNAGIIDNHSQSWPTTRNRCPLHDGLCKCKLLHPSPAHAVAPRPDFLFSDLNVCGGNQ